jgi:uncharacterized membrane protein
MSDIPTDPTDPTPPPPASDAPGKDAVREQDKLMLVLSYLGLLALVPLLTIKDSEYVHWHARQGVALFLCWVGYSIALSILGMIPFIGWLLATIGMFGHLGLMALTVIAIVKAFEPTRWRIPIAADVADKINL